MKENLFRDSSIFLTGNNPETFLHIFKNFNAGKIFILTDENTAKLCLEILMLVIHDRYEIHILRMKSGEQFKTPETCFNIWNELSALGADKNSWLINLGGGVVTDMGGFVASTFLRGIKFINIPTTLMGMADAAIGGKNGLDLNTIKNQIGTIHFPEAVIIHPQFLDTLPEKHFQNGLAEIYKHALIADKKLWINLPSEKFKKSEINFFLIDAIEVKKNIVGKDPHDSDIRKILNFGHTIGHAIESIYLNADEPLLHGEAVVIGMIMETWLSEKISGLSVNKSDEIINKLNSVFGRFSIKVSIEELERFLNYDKKNQNSNYMFSLLTDIGSCKWNIPVKIDLIKEVLDKYQAVISN